MKYLKEISITSKSGSDEVNLLLEENPEAVEKYIPVQRKGTNVVVPALSTSDIDELMLALFPYSSCGQFLNGVAS